jgi:Chitobiase/beta-hexosaminidase C-terminal domain
MRLAIVLLFAASAFAQYTPTPRTYTDNEIGLILQSCLNNSLAANCNGTGQYGVGFNIQNPNTITQFTQMTSGAIKAWHGVGQHWAAGAQHNASFDLRDELEAYQAAEVRAGRKPLLITSGGNPVYWDNSTFPYGKQPINICDSRFVRFIANEQIRRRMLSPSNPGAVQSPQYQNGWQSWDEGFYLGPQTTSGVYGFPGGVSDGVAWDEPFPQTQASWTACAASFYAQLYAIAPDINITLNQGALAEPNGTINDKDLALFQQIYNASPNLNVDRETFFTPGTSSTDTEVLFDIVQNITKWLLTTGRTAVFRGLVDGTAGQIESTALAYLITREGNSFFSEASGSNEVDPNNSTFAWAPVYDQMGNPTSAPSTIACVSGGSDYSNVVFTRTYEGGLVYYNNCTSTQTITLPAGTWYNASGSVVTTLTLLSYAGGVDTLVAQYVTSTNYSSAPIVQQPQISPLGNGAITGPVTATITDGTSGAGIHYTTNGTQPTCSSPLYSGPLTIASTTTLAAIACNSGNTPSWERATNYTMTATNPTAQFALATDSATPFFTLTYAAITLSNPSASTVTVNYTVSGDSNITFSPSSGSAVFQPFQTAVAIPISASLASTVALDSITASIGTGTGYTVGARSTYKYTIQRDFLPTVTPQYAEINASTCATGRSDIITNNQDCSAETTLATGTTSTPATFISAYSFPLTSIPANATITKATALFYIPTFTDAAADQIPATMSRITTAYTQTTADWTNYFSTSSNWSGSATSTTTAIAGDVTGNTSATLTANQNGNHYLLTADVQNIVNGTYTNNYGWILQGPTAPAGTEQWSQLTSNSANAPQSQPSLLVQYTTPASPTITLNLPTISTAYCTVTAGSQVTLAGTVCPLTVTIGNAATVYAVEFWRDASVIGGVAYGEREAIVRTAPHSYNFDTFNFGNGVHTLTAILRDPLNNILATSSPVSLLVENFQPQATSPTTDISVTTGEVTEMTIPGALTWGMNTISFEGSGILSLVGTSHFANSATSPTWTATAGNLIACFARWQSGTGTMTATDTAGDTPAYGALNANPGGAGFSTQWVYFAGIAGGSTHVSISTTTGSVFLTDCLEIHGAALSSPKDYDAVTGNNSPTPASAPYTLGYPANNEIILGGASWGGASITATAGPGYTMFQDANGDSGVEYIVPPANAWFSNVGLSWTVNGPNSGISKTVQLNVDGFVTVSNTGVAVASGTTILNTAQFLNAAHNVVLTVTGGNCVGCTNGTWNTMGQWEQVETFANGAVPSQLLMTYRDFKLCVTPSTNCPSSRTQNVIVQNTDGSTGTASSYSWVINYSSIGGVFPSSTVPITLSSTTNSSATVAVVAGMQNNATSVTVSAVTANGTLSRTFWVNIPPDAVGAYTPHFERNGSISTAAYDPSSIWYASAFFSQSNGFNPYGLTAAVGGQVAITSSINYAAIFGPQYAIPFNTQEYSIDAPGTSGSSGESQYDALVNYHIGVALGYQTSYGIGAHLIGDSTFASTPTLFNEIYGQGASYATPPLKYWLNQATAQGLTIRGATLADEVSSKWPGAPFAGVSTSGIFVGSFGFTSIDCTVSPARLNVTTAWGGFVGNEGFIIHGSGDTSLDYNFTSGNASEYVAGSGNSGYYTFPRPSGCTALHNASTYPNMQIEPLVAWTAPATAACSGVGATCTGMGNSTTMCPSGGVSTGPCPAYNGYNAIYLYLQQWNSATNPPAATAPPAAGVTGLSASWYSGKLNVSGVGFNYYDFYWSPAANTYLADKINATDVIASQGNNLRADYQWLNLGAPLISEAAGAVIDYMAQGYPISVASCAGNTITTTLPHAVYNIQPGLTRLTVTGSSGANCDGNWYVLASPTSTTLTVAQANATVSSSTATGGTITFDNGQTWPLSSITPSTSGNNEGGWSGVGISTCPNTAAGSVQWKSLRGHTFTLSGTSVAAYNTNFTGVFMEDVLDACPASGASATSTWRQIPNITASTGGTAQIIKNHWYLRGDNWQNNSETGATYFFASHLASLIWHASGVRVYLNNEDPQIYDRTLVGIGSPYLASSIGLNMFGITNFNCNHQACPQAGIDPRTDYAKTFAGWVAHTNASLMAQREIPYAFGQQLPAPDYGRFYEAAAWTSARGQLLAIQSFADNTTTLAANLAPYLVSNQSIYRICAEWNTIKAIATIPAGSATDVYTYAPGEHCAYIFANNAATEVQQPTLSVRLADVANAAKVVVEFSYSPHAFVAGSARTQVLYQTQDCGNAATCQLNVDRTVGTVFYRLFYLNSSNAVIATSDIQTL